VTDVVLALLLGSILLIELVASNVTTSPLVGVPACLLMTIPLAWRRSLPLLASIAAATGWVVLRVADDSPQEMQSTLLVVALAVYSAAAYAERRHAVAGLVVTLCAATLIEPGDLIVMGPLFVGVWLAGRLFRDRQHLAVALAERTAALERERAETARLAIAEERSRIARELHDVVAHSVSVMVVQAGAERLALAGGADPSQDALRAIEDTGRAALSEMRRLLGMLRDEGAGGTIAPQPGIDTLEALVAGVREAGLPVELAIDGDRRALSPGLDVSVYRIVQEALTNALRHAEATRANVHLRFAPDVLELEVSDDGRGARDTDGAGHGLTGMRERARLFGGELEAGNGFGRGFVVTARFPLVEVAG
jgi:signal transduction histidine kinase